MTDGIRGGINQITSDVREAVVKPVVDEVGKALEIGVQSVMNKTPQPQSTASQPDPLQQQQIMQRDQISLTDARRKIKYWQDLGLAQQKVRQQEKQKEETRLKQDDKKKEIKQYQIEKRKKEDIAVKQAQTKTEVKKGLGG